MRACGRRTGCSSCSARVLGLFAGLLTGLPISGALEGNESLVVYAVLGIATLVILFVMLNFLALLTTVSDHGLEFRFGLFARRFTWNEINGAEAKQYNWLSYGGWGIRIAFGGRRAWSLLGVSHGVEVSVTGSNDRQLTYFVSSARPDEMAAALTTGHGGTRRGFERSPIRVNDIPA